MRRAVRRAVGTALLALPAAAGACALHGGTGFGFDHGYGGMPDHVAEDWAPAPPVARTEAVVGMSAAARMARQRELMLARYPALRAGAAEGSAPSKAD